MKTCSLLRGHETPVLFRCEKLPWLQLLEICYAGVQSSLPLCTRVHTAVCGGFPYSRTFRGSSNGWHRGSVGDAFKPDFYLTGHGSFNLDYNLNDFEVNKDSSLVDRQTPQMMVSNNLHLYGDFQKLVVLACSRTIKIG